MKNDRISQVAADLTRLPYADESFDAIVCGWVLEHLPDPRPGLRDLARVLRPGGKMLLLVTEDTLTGAMCSRMWHCRTHNRENLKRDLRRVRAGFRPRSLVFASACETAVLGGLLSS